MTEHRLLNAAKLTNSVLIRDAQKRKKANSSTGDYSNPPDRSPTAALEAPWHTAGRLPR